MKRILLAISLMLPLVAMGQKPKKAAPALPEPPAPTVLSVGDIVGNYGLDTAWINDTAAAMR